MAKTALQSLRGIDLPIIQAPMAGVQGSALAAAVSNASGLGWLPAAMRGLPALRTERAALRAATNRLFNVNFFCPEVQLDFAPDAVAVAA
jgi:nitronate monooxygenase